MEAALHLRDLEAPGLDGGERVARRVAAAERTRPEERVDGALHRSERGSRRANVLPEAQLPAGPEHAAQLDESLGGLGHAAEEAHDDGRVEGPVVRGQRLGDSLDHLDRNRRAPGPLDGVRPRSRIRLDGEDARRAGRVVLERAAVARARPRSPARGDAGEQSPPQLAEDGVGTPLLAALEVGREARLSRSVKGRLGQEDDYRALRFLLDCRRAQLPRMNHLTLKLSGGRDAGLGDRLSGALGMKGDLGLRSIAHR